MRMIVLFLSTIVFLGHTALAYGTLKTTPSSMDLPEPFNIVGSFVNEKDSTLVNYEIEACGQTFKFTFKRDLVYKRPKYVSEQIWIKLSEICGWDD